MGPFTLLETNFAKGMELGRGFPRRMGGGRLTTKQHFALPSYRYRKDHFATAPGTQGITLPTKTLTRLAGLKCWPFEQRCNVFPIGNHGGDFPAFSQDGKKNPQFWDGKNRFLVTSGDGKKKTVSASLLRRYHLQLIHSTPLDVWILVEGVKMGCPNLWILLEVKTHAWCVILGGSPPPTPQKKKTQRKKWMHGNMFFF